MATATSATAPPSGLTEAEATRRLAARGPLPSPATSRSYASLVRANAPPPPPPRRPPPAPGHEPLLREHRPCQRPHHLQPDPGRLRRADARLRRVAGLALSPGSWPLRGARYLPRGAGG